MAGRDQERAEPVAAGAENTAAHRIDPNLASGLAPETLSALVLEPGEHLVYGAASDLCVHRIDAEWTRIGRSAASEIRFDDPTVSRRHALVVRRPDGLKLIDDRSLNGVFVNGERVELHPLRDGDCIQVGRHSIHFVAIVVQTPLREILPAEALRV